nr:MAG TPA: hypothetical protein [Caudoviricetes sp.]
MSTSTLRSRRGAASTLKKTISAAHTALFMRPTPANSAG